jgi:hypothetical protein
MEVAMPYHLIRRIRLAHCARGPERCAACREMDREVPALLDVDPPNYGMVARRMVEVEFAGARTWREFDVARVFESAEEARAYAAEQGVADVAL